METAWVASERRPWRRATALAVTLFPLFVAEALLVRRALKGAHDTTFDLYAFVVDDRLGGQLSFWLGRLFAASPPISFVFNQVYLALPTMLGLFYGWARREPASRRALGAVILLFFSSVLAVIGYRIVPVAGPRFALAGFPDQIPQLLPSEVHRLVLDPEIERNGVPSLHFASALLIWWSFRRAGTLLGTLGAAFLVGTFIATLGTGEHFLVDLIISVPFALALHAGFMAQDIAPSAARWRAIAIGSALTAVWVVALRSAWFVLRGPIWILALLTATSVIVPAAVEFSFGRTRGGRVAGGDIQDRLGYGRPG
jgi:hypothetical protein